METIRISVMVSIVFFRRADINTTQYSGGMKSAKNALMPFFSN